MNETNIVKETVEPEELKKLKDFNEFIEDLNEEVSSSLGSDYNCLVSEVHKTNDITLHALSIMKKDLNISPCLYLEAYYLDYLHGMTIKEVADKLIGYYLVCMENVPEGFDKMNDKIRYEEIKYSLRGKLINFESNRKLLETMPYRRFLDLAITYYFEEENQYIINISNDIMKELDIDEDCLYSQMIHNMNLHHDWQIADIYEILAQDINCIPNSEANRIFVLTRTDMKLGAIEMIDEDAMSETSKLLGEDFYIIPSSIHELILIPKSKCDNAAALTETIHDMNMFHVEKTDILSDSLYMYDIRKGKVEIACWHE